MALMARVRAHLQSSTLPARAARGLLVAALVLSGVATGPACAASDGMIEKLYDSTRAYNRSLRWGDWDRAAEHLPVASANASSRFHSGSLSVMRVQNSVISGSTSLKAALRSAVSATDSR